MRCREAQGEGKFVTLQGSLDYNNMNVRTTLIGNSIGGAAEDLFKLGQGEAGLQGQDGLQGFQAGMPVRQDGLQRENRGDDAASQGLPVEAARRQPIANPQPARRSVDDEELFGGPDLSDAIVRAEVGFLTGTFKIPPVDPDIPDVWVENVRDALFTSGMAAIYRAADCRVKAEVPVRLRNEVDAIPRWKHAFAWSTPPVPQQHAEPFCPDWPTQICGHRGNGPLCAGRFPSQPC